MQTASRTRTHMLCDICLLSTNQRRQCINIDQTIATENPKDDQSQRATAIDVNPKGRPHRLTSQILRKTLIISTIMVKYRCVTLSIKIHSFFFSAHIKNRSVKSNMVYEHRSSTVGHKTTIAHQNWLWIRENIRGVSLLTTRFTHRPSCSRDDLWRMLAEMWIK